MPPTWVTLHGLTAAKDVGLVHFWEGDEEHEHGVPGDRHWLVEEGLPWRFERS